MGISHHHHHNHPPSLLTKKLLTYALYSLLPLALLHYLLFPLISPHHHSSPIPPPSPHHAAGAEEADRQPGPKRPTCDYSSGTWVRGSAGPPYNGTGCATIKDGQNCMAHGRPDAGYLRWRWRPAGQCELPAFEPVSFLDLIRGKHLAFVGDSMARNQLESLLCLLSVASSPDLVFRDGEEGRFRRWAFRAHNATVSVFWSPFLVKGVEKSADLGLNHNKLYLDSADERWAAELGGIDVVVFSIGHWFLHPAVYYEGGAVLGCHHCPELNHTEIGFFDVFRKAVRTALREVVERGSGSSPESFGKLVVVTTFSPAHFEGEWDRAGACPRTEPYQEGEKEMEYMDKEMRKVELEEVAAAAADGKLRVEALDVTKMAFLRPDGHPGPYMHADPFAGGQKERVQNDCVHWCQPGPIDAWNEILVQMVKRWERWVDAHEDLSVLVH